MGVASKCAYMIYYNMSIMNKITIPTHKKYGWIWFVAGFFLTGLISMPFPKSIIETLVFGTIQWVFAIAFIIEIVATVIGKNKIQ